MIKATDWQAKHSDTISCQLGEQLQLKLVNSMFLSAVYPLPACRAAQGAALWPAVECAGHRLLV